MSKVLVAKRNRKLGSIPKNNKKSKWIDENKKEINVKANNSKVFEMENLLTENRDEKLEIFYQKEMKKSSLPSLSTLLPSSTKHSEISSLLNNSIEKPQQRKVAEYTQNEDIFVSKIAKSMFNTNEQLDEGTSSPFDKNPKKSRDYSISDMFSDGLSQKDNIGQEFNYVSSPEISQADLLLPTVNIDEKKSGDLLPKNPKCRIESKIQRNLVKNGPAELRPETFNPESNSLRKILESSKQPKETVKNCEMGNSPKSNKNLKTFYQKVEKKNSSSTSVPLGKMDSGISSLLHNSIRNYDNNFQPRICCNEKNQTSSPGDKTDEKNKDPLTPGEITADSDKSESSSIEIPLSDCNLDYVINSGDSNYGSIEMIHKKAIWYMDQASESTEMDNNVGENLRLTGLELNMIKNDSIGSKEENNTSLDSFQLSDPFVELSGVGPQLSGLNNYSLTPYMPEFESSPNCKTSFEEKDNLVHRGSRHSSFGISQSMYIRKRSPFFNRNTTKNETMPGFELFRSNATETEEFRPEINLPIFPNQTNTFKYEFSDSNKGKGRSIFDSQGEGISHEKFTDSSAKIWALSNSASTSKKRRYPFDDDSKFSDIEIDEACRTCEIEKQAAKNVGEVQNTWSENRNISIDQISYPSSKSSVTSGKNALKRPPLSKFWKASHQVQTLVKGWLDTQDETNCEISERFANRERLLIKRSRLDLDSDKKEKSIDVDPGMLLSNYSCEYNKPYLIEHFKPK